MENSGILPAVPPNNGNGQDDKVGAVNNNASLASTHLSIPSAATSANTPKMGSQTNKMASMKLNKEEQKKMLASRKKTPIEILVLKIVAILVTAAAFLVFFLTMIDLDPENDYLSVFGLAENTGQKHTTLKAENEVHKESAIDLDKKIKDLKQRLENEDYFVNNDIINEIESGQFNWVDRVDEDTEKMIIGILEFSNDGRLF